MELEGRDPKVQALVGMFDQASDARRNGRRDEAAEGYRKMLACAMRVPGPDRAPLAAVAAHMLADTLDGRIDDKSLAAALKIAHATEAGGEAGWTVRFALGRVAAREDPGRAMTWYAAANAMRRAALTYNADLMDGLFDALAETFDSETVERLASSGTRSRKPVFIVGMPRSGTSLLEQVLASVPGVHGAGELNVMAEIAQSIHQEEGGWPHGARRLTPTRAQSLATRYLTRLHALAPTADRVIDKMPANAQNVGLILSLFPNATIIYQRRDPMDVCFGVYRQLFAGNVSYAYDQTEIGRYHRGLEALMDTWIAALPGRIVVADYATLVTDFEAEARRLVAAIGMPWTDACLAFHKTDRQIETASAAQARQPLYKTALGAADPYRPYLEPLAKALAA